MPGHVCHAPAYSEIMVNKKNDYVVRKDKEYENCSVREK